MENLTAILRQNASPENGQSKQTTLQTEDAPKELSAEEKAECARIRQKYALPENFKDTQIDVQRIKLAEAEIDYCRKCKGLPCKKRGFYQMRECVPCIKFKGADAISNRLSFGVYYANCSYVKESKLRAQIEKNQGLLKIPVEYVGKTFLDYTVDADNDFAVRAAKFIIAHKHKGAYFYGEVGTGKTFLVSIIAQEIIKRGRQVIFTTLPNLSMELRSTFNKTQEVSEKDVLEKLFKVPTLILDDVGIEKTTRFVSSMVSNLFNERYNAKLQTIMTSNYPLEVLKEIYNTPSDGGLTLDGTRIYDRCKQMCYPVELKGKSRR